MLLVYFDNGFIVFGLVIPGILIVIYFFLLASYGVKYASFYRNTKEHKRTQSDLLKPTETYLSHT